MSLTAFSRTKLARRLIGTVGAGVLLVIPSLSGALIARAQDGAPAKTNPNPQTAGHGIVVAPDLMAELAKFKPVQMPFDSSHLSAREQQMVAKLVEACQNLESIYWRQSDPEGLELYHALAASRDPKDIALRRYLRINGSRFDLIKNNAPFVGTLPMPPGRAIFSVQISLSRNLTVTSRHTPGRKRRCTIR